MKLNCHDGQVDASPAPNDAASRARVPLDAGMAPNRQRTDPDEHCAHSCATGDYATLGAIRRHTGREDGGFPMTGTDVGLDQPIDRPIPHMDATTDSWGEESDRHGASRAGPLTKMLAALVLAGLAFYAGVKVEHDQAARSASPAPNRLATVPSSLGTSRRPSTAGSGAAGVSPGAFGSALRASGPVGGITGTVKLVDGSNVYVSEADGSIVKVATNAGSTISVTGPGTAAKLHPGDTVTVSGPTGKNGTITAKALSDGGVSGTSSAGVIGAPSALTAGTAAGGLPAGGPPGGP
jgi:hypothetical protein